METGNSHNVQRLGQKFLRLSPFRDILARDILARDILTSIDTIGHVGLY